jgi:hypothetical protein
MAGGWPEYEDRAGKLCDWSPSIVTGLLQTEGYAHALTSTLPGVTPDTVTARVAGRMQRQRRVLSRDDPPRAWFVVDELSLYREVGSAQVMAAQMRHLIEVAAMPTVTIQVLPPIAHPVNASGFLLADDSAWVEHVVGGFTYTEREIVSGLALRFDTLRAESYRASETLRLVERLERQWTATGGRAPTPMPTEGTA